MTKRIYILISLLFIFFTLSGCEKNESNIIYGKDHLSINENKSEFVMIDLKGEVCFPGVYEVPKGSTMYDLLKLCGGFTSEANTNMVNLTMELANNQMIIIPKLNGQTDDTYKPLININFATVEELSTLPGIGNAKANSIIAYRTEYGYFMKIDDIMNVSGIGSELFAKIKDFICI